MIEAGITGGIGSGKSMVCRIVASMGYPVYYADTRSRHLLDHDHEVKRQVVQAFGSDVYHDGGLNRQALAAIVFADPEKLRILEGISHPAVKKDYDKWVAVQHSSIVFKEAALLYESGSYKDLDTVIVVHAPLEVRMERVMGRDNTKREAVQARMNQQWPQEQKIALADHTIHNDGATPLLPQVLSVIQAIQAGN